MTTKLHTGKVCLPSRPQAIAFLERRKLTGLFFRLLLYVVQIYISHLLLLRRPTDLKKIRCNENAVLLREKKKRNPFDLFGQSLLTYIERRLLRKAKKGEEGKLRDASAHIFSFLSIFPEGSKHVIMLYSGKSGCIIIIDPYTVAQK